MTSAALTVSLNGVRMSYVTPKRYREYLLHPFRRPARLEALREITMGVPAGRRLAVFGENGAGKTTLLKLIAGLLLPTGGEIIVNGFDTVRHGNEVRQHIGYVINEERSFFWRLSGFENLRFFAALENLFGQSARLRIETVLDDVGLTKHAHRPVAQYSCGMRQRLALARGLLGDPKILLLDEPTRSLDPRGTDSIHELLGGNLARGRTMIMATNRFEDAAMLCGHLAVIRAGTVVATSQIDGRGALQQVVGFVRDQLGCAPA